MTSERMERRERFPGTRAAERLLAEMRTNSSLAWKEENGAGYFERSKNGETEKIFPENVDANESEETIATWAHDVAVQRQKSFVAFGDADAVADTEGAKEDIRAGDTKIVLMRKENGDAIGYAEFELRDIEPDERGRKESFIFDWLVHVDPEYRGSGLGATTYALAAERCLAQAREEKKDVVAIVTSAIEVGGASFTRGMSPTYPFITDADGRTVELRDMPIPDTSDSYSGEVRGKVFRPMIRFIDHKETRPTADVSRIFASMYKGYGEGGDDAYQAIIEKAARLAQQVLEKSADGTISLLDGGARSAAKERAGEHFIEAEQFSAWLAHHPDLQQQYEELEAANAAYGAVEAGT